MRPSNECMDNILGQQFTVHGNGFVRVIDYMGDDAAIVQAARVSYGQGTKTKLEDAGLIHYLMEHRHTTPFEMCEIKLHVKLPIFVARQWVRHRTASMNEYSARYSEVPEEFYFPEASSIKGQSKSNKQGSEGELGKVTIGMFQAETQLTFAEAHEGYRGALAAGISRELARINLPLSTMTEFYWKIDLHNLLHFLKLRADEHAQPEIRAYADVMLEIIREWVPASVGAFEEHVLHAVTLSRSEWEVVKRFAAGEVVCRNDTDLSDRQWNHMAGLLCK